MTDHPVVTRDAWLAARLALLEEEKAFTRRRDELSRKIRALPWVRIDKPYRFTGPAGELSLEDLFEGRSQLIVYHFMLGPDWEAGCKSCSFWADNYQGGIVHMNQRDVTFCAVSRAPLDKIEAYKARMGWTFPWYSSHASDFNFDFRVSFTPDELANGAAVYNFETQSPRSDEMPGLSVFARNADGAVFHTYSTYARGLDILNGAYHHLDLVPKGRDEDGLAFSQSWVKRHDEY
jgi:predicted dithiol-disulfide oxidoreductase (DUF899 family)